MKLYNPFRWHAAETPTGQFVVRRRPWWLFCWTYADVSGDGYVWTSFNHVCKYCYTPQKNEAIALAQRLRQTARVIWP